MYHNPVLLQESIDGMNIRPDGIYVDVTFGGGGHSKAILDKLETGHLFAFDQDQDALRNTLNDNKFTLINHNFRYLKNFLKYYDALPVDGILADLGVSSHQFDVSERGFSMRFDDALDMRMNRRQKKSAVEVLNEFTEEQLANIFRNYGELPNAGALSRAICNHRKNGILKTFADIEKVLGKFAQRGKENKFFAKVLQALRIEINEELEALREMLQQSAEVLADGGRLVVISYHSLEDRLVKNFMRTGNFGGTQEKDFYGNPLRIFESNTKKPIAASPEEQNLNSRSRSARLRIASKLKPIIS
ncbi:MAG: 16S rRNA (cytosine(1402)-N(4))-methyltransferase RsmH [Bacteroidales bacterium]|nr:16S rRNA (cytosine(1402)-N(4))-methyltransferase RsmH [Bacteroidales bacterium]